jgi:hypothetical protein
MSIPKSTRGEHIGHTQRDSDAASSDSTDVDKQIKGEPHRAKREEHRLTSKPRDRDEQEGRRVAAPHTMDTHEDAIDKQHEHPRISTLASVLASHHKKESTQEDGSKQDRSHRTSSPRAPAMQEQDRHTGGRRVSNPEEEDLDKGAAHKMDEVQVGDQHARRAHTNNDKPGHPSRQDHEESRREEARRAHNERANAHHSPPLSAHRTMSSLHAEDFHGTRNRGTQVPSLRELASAHKTRAESKRQEPKSEDGSHHSSENLLPNKREPLVSSRAGHPHPVTSSSVEGRHAEKRRLDPAMVKQQRNGEESRNETSIKRDHLGKGSKPNKGVHDKSPILSILSHPAHDEHKRNSRRVAFGGA